MKKTLIVSLFGGPGSGKSTTCAGLFAALKQKGFSCEMVLEYAKELVWENNTTKLADQIYIFAKQNRRTNIVLGRVDVIVTDSPLLLSIIYGADKYPEFKALVAEEYSRLWTLDAMIMRTPGNYQHEGREQDEAGALVIDDRIKGLLTELNIEPLPIYGTLEERVDMLQARIVEMLAENKDEIISEEILPTSHITSVKKFAVTLLDDISFAFSKFSSILKNDNKQDE